MSLSQGPLPGYAEESGAASAPASPLVAKISIAFAQLQIEPKIEVVTHFWQLDVIIHKIVISYLNDKSPWWTQGMKSLFSKNPPFARASEEGDFWALAAFGFLMDKRLPFREETGPTVPIPKGSLCKKVKEAVSAPEGESAAATPFVVTPLAEIDVSFYDDRGHDAGGKDAAILDGFF